MSVKNNENRCHQMSFLKLNRTKFDFG